MNKLELLLTNVFVCVCNEINGDAVHISEDVSTEEIIEVCEEYKLTDLKEKLVRMKDAYDNGDYDTINDIQDELLE